MHRLGVAPETVPQFYQRLSATGNAVDAVVTYTHFASADDVHSQQTQRQLAVFDALPCGALRSAANSAGLLAWPAGALRLGAPRLHAVRQLPDAAGSSAGPGPSTGNDPHLRSNLPARCRCRRSRGIRWYLGGAATLAHRHGNHWLRRRLPAPRCPTARRYWSTDNARRWRGVSPWI